MVGVTFWGGVDLASIAIWAFWIFFAGLVIYIQRENTREGYPLVDDDGNDLGISGWSLPSKKTFKLPHGRGDVVVPSAENEEAHDRKDLALARTSASPGSPYVPTGDPMADGVGPASWAPRRDAPELDAHGHAKIRPMSALEDFKVSAGKDPRGLVVEAGDKEPAGKIVDMLIDVPEHMVRYLVVELKDGAGQRMIPINLCRIKWNRVAVRSIFAEHFPGIPTTASGDQITLLEEEKITAYFAGGTLYADPSRLESQL